MIRLSGPRRGYGMIARYLAQRSALGSDEFFIIIKFEKNIITIE
jgi:hypothetical protein